MKKKNLKFLTVISVVSLSLFFIPSSKPAQAEVTSPTGYLPITWVSEPGIQTFMKAPSYAGYIDFITDIDLTKNQIKVMGEGNRVDGGPPAEPFTVSTTTQNWLFPRFTAESFKQSHNDVKFFWDISFFNTTMSTTTLSFALKSSDAKGSYISSGSRPGDAISKARRMLIIDNKTGLAEIKSFDLDTFVNKGDQAVEGLAPFEMPSSDIIASRLFVGVKNGGKNLLVYCSKNASVGEASDALLNAGVSTENQIQLDGGGSTTCAYNLSGQHFVEPGRALPVVMGVVPILNKGNITINNLNVRTGPGVANPVVKKLALGTEVIIHEEKDGWLRISDKEWVHSNYVKKIKGLPFEASITIEGLNVRKGAGTSFGVTRKLHLGDKVKVLEEKNGWMRISDTEWVLGDYVSN